MLMDGGRLVSGFGMRLVISSSTRPTVKAELLFTSTYSTKAAKFSREPFPERHTLVQIVSLAHQIIKVSGVILQGMVILLQAEQLDSW